MKRLLGARGGDPEGSARSLSLGDVLLPSRDFCLTFDHAGAPVYLQLAEPHRLVRLSRELSELTAAFARRGGASIELAGRTLSAELRAKKGARFDRWLLGSAEALAQSGLLVRGEDDEPLYDSVMVKDYSAHRGAPDEVSEIVAREMGIERTTTILDMGTGTGRLAIALARRSDRVTGMDLSRPFLRQVRRDARAAGVRLRLIHDSCDRLLLHPDAYEAVTISEALHWLDPVLAARGIYHVLKPGGLLFILETRSSLPHRHPLRRMFPAAYPTEKRSLQGDLRHRIEQYARLFAAARYGGRLLGPRAGWIVSRKRRFELGHANAWFTRSHRLHGGSGSVRDRWDELVALFEAAPPQDLRGAEHWLIMAYENGEGTAPRSR